MPDRMHEKLGAYLDGELQGQSLIEMQNHLKTCPACQKELEALRHLSHLLHAAPLPDFMPAGRFTSELMLQLPRRGSVSRPNDRTRLIAWAFPAIVLLAWAFLQTTFGLAQWIAIAQQAGILDPIATWMPTAPQEMGWFTGIQLLAGNSLNLNRLELLNDLGLFLQGLAVPLIWEFILVSLYWAWLAIWWQHRHKKLVTSSNEH